MSSIELKSPKLCFQPRHTEYKYKKFDIKHIPIMIAIRELYIVTLPSLQSKNVVETTYYSFIGSPRIKELRTSVKN